MAQWLKHTYRRMTGEAGWRMASGKSVVASAPGFRGPDGTLGSKSGFSSEKAAREWGDEQEALIRRKIWIDNRDSETLFGVFAQDWLDAVKARLERGTVAKYVSHLNSQLLPQWQAWPLMSICDSYVEIEKWVSELHEDYAESTVSSVFATFSTVLGAAVGADDPG
jgi:hypothetical protein